jgi:chaperonin cofactor prefoldin
VTALNGPQDTSPYSAASVSNLKYTTSDVSIGSVSRPDMVRLNDTLRSTGLAPLRRDADVHDVVDCAVDAIRELTNRTQGLLNASSFSDTCRIRLPEPPKSPKRQIRPIPPSIPSVSLDEYNALMEENRRVSQAAQRYKTEASSLERSLRMKSEECDKLQSQLQAKCKEQDQRSALAMTTLRTQRLPHSTLLVVENYQKRINTLEDDNNALTKRMSSLMYRIKILESEKQHLHTLMRGTISADANTASLAEERDTLVACVDELEKSVSCKEKKIQELESKLTQSVPDQTRSSTLVSICAILGIPSSDPPSQIISQIKKLDEIFHGPYFALNEFIRSISDTRIETVDKASLRVLSDSISIQKSKAGQFDRITQILDNHRLRDGSVSERIESLITKANSPGVVDGRDLVKFTSIIKELSDTLGVRDPDQLRQSVERTLFKLHELQNFYKTLSHLLGLSNSVSFLKCIERIEGLVRGPAGGPVMGGVVAGRERGDPDHSDLAWSRQLIRIPKHD